MKKIIGKFLSLIFIGIVVGVCVYYFEDIEVKEKEESQEPVNEIFQGDLGYQYYYKDFTHEEQIAYRQLYAAIVNFRKNVYIEHMSVSQVKKIYNALIKDHPEIFYIEDYFYSTEMENYIDVEICYIFNQQTVQKYNQQIEQTTQKIIQKANQQKKDIDKIKLIYDDLIDYVSYGEGEHDQNIKSVFIDKKSVCAGYAKAYQYLLLKAGVNCTYMTGVAREDLQGHAWVMVYIDNEYYYSDPTWGDIEDKGMKHHCYITFLMTSDEMLKCYLPEDKYEKTKNGQLNYYKDIGCYMEKYDRRILSHAIQNGLKNKSRVAEVKCGSDKVYKKLKNAVENDYLGYYVLSENHCYSEKAKYSWDDDLKVIEIFY